MTQTNFDWFLHVMLFYYTQHVLNKQADNNVEEDDDPEFEDLNQFVIQLIDMYLYDDSEFDNLDKFVIQLTDIYVYKFHNVTLTLKIWNTRYIQCQYLWQKEPAFECYPC